MSPVDPWVFRKENSVKVLWKIAHQRNGKYIVTN